MRALIGEFAVLERGLCGDASASWPTPVLAALKLCADGHCYWSSGALGALAMRKEVDEDGGKMAASWYMHKTYSQYSMTRLRDSCI